MQVSGGNQEPSLLGYLDPLRWYLLPLGSQVRGLGGGHLLGEAPCRQEPKTSPDKPDSKCELLSGVDVLSSRFPLCQSALDCSLLGAIVVYAFRLNRCKKPPEAKDLDEYPDNPRCLN